jgi:hypothetical protein
VQELLPRIAQLASVGALSFINVHAPTDCGVAREILFNSLSPHLSLLCVLHLIDQSSTVPLRKSNKYSPALASLIDAGSYVDSYRVLHPTTPVFSFHHRGCKSSRLDRIYLPPLLEYRLRVARYLPCTSDHHAYFLNLETAGLAVLASLVTKRSASLYWKLNSSILKDQTFLPAFQEMWASFGLSTLPTSYRRNGSSSSCFTGDPDAFRYNGDPNNVFS